MINRFFSFILILLIYSAFGLPNVKAAPSFLVNSDWMEAHIDDPDLVILEVRYHPHRYLTIGHIPGAQQVQRFKDLGDNDAATLMFFPSRADFQESLRRWGVNDNSTVILYDDSRTALASRLFFLLDLYGYNMEQVKVLDGGALGWQGFNDLSKEMKANKPGTVTLKEADKNLFIGWTDVYDNVVSRRDPSIVLLDARPTDHYTGKVLQHAVRGGHIPGAVNIVSLEGTNSESQTWEPMEDLAHLYQNLPKGKTVYAYCHDGFRMSLAYMQLKALGYKDVRLYNGGWGHWGNRLSLPVVEGPEPFNEDFKL